VPGPAGLVFGLPGLDGADRWGLMISSNSPLEFVFVNVIRYCGSYLSVIDGVI
jgi:hypothetical protein